LISSFSIWIDFLRDEETPEQERANKTKADLVTLVKLHKDSFLVFKFLSVLFKKLNDNENYEKCIKAAYKINPKDIEIAREFRLYKMRKDKENRGGFLGFKIKK